MELEKQRGISITSTVLQFDYAGSTINLLDTPGHQDFSEDTYRTLAAADNAVMLEDAAKGLEPQTRKLFEVCRMRQIPIFTFINKMDRPGREPLELIDEIEKELKLACWPVNWPIGSGDRFRGVIDRRSKQVILFARAERGKQSVERSLAWNDPELAELVEPDLLALALEELELLDGAGADLDLELVHGGELSPVFLKPILQSHIQMIVCLDF
jgi:peptide chain release factor 3